MNVHQNAGLTPRGQKMFISPLEQGERVGDVGAFLDHHNLGGLVGSAQTHWAGRSTLP